MYRLHHLDASSEDRASVIERAPNEFIEVVAGRKCRPTRLEHDHSDRAIASQRAESVPNPSHHVHRQWITSIRIRQSDPPNGSVGADAD